MSDNTWDLWKAEKCPNDFELNATAKEKRTSRLYTSNYFAVLSAGYWRDQKMV